MATKKKVTKVRSLSNGRPPFVKQTASLSSKATRTVIRTHHTLEKRRATALANGDGDAVTELSRQINARGGLQTYQSASLTGQGGDRGGDSSRILMDWIEPILPAVKSTKEAETSLRMLEIGALSASNACSQSGLFKMERIDLHSQAKEIMQQDFMERPIPTDDLGKFDIISLSLVLNFVPDPVGRGLMLEHTLKFLRDPVSYETKGSIAEFFPSLFLVLPASCVTNSRYMDEAKLEAMMESLGYLKVEKKLSSKLAYYLWRVPTSSRRKRRASFKKIELRSGKTRNNFSIVFP